MSSKIASQKSSYLPVSWDFRETIEEESAKKSTGKIFYFDNNEEVGEAKGSVVNMVEEKNDGLYVVLDTGDRVRADRIITLFGKIGPAYDEYDSYANACMNCTGGYDPDEL